MYMSIFFSSKTAYLSLPYHREFFFSGTGDPTFRLNTILLFEDTAYTDEIKSLINEKLPQWLKEENHAYPIEDKEYLHKMKKKEEKKKHFHERLFGRHYTDNFQLRSLAGVTDDQPISNVVSQNCTLYFAAVDMLFDECGKVYTAAVLVVVSGHASMKPRPWDHCNKVIWIMQRRC